MVDFNDKNSLENLQILLKGMITDLGRHNEQIGMLLKGGNRQYALIEEQGKIISNLQERIDLIESEGWVEQ
tara:strand:+ start:4081 stop:4293 length:213 start_codon:yes stop_codon:yes gene_type:complete